MSEHFPSSAVSHASLDKDLYGMDVSTEAMQRRESQAGAMRRLDHEEATAAFERLKAEDLRKELAAGALRAFEAREAGKSNDPTLGFREKERENALAARELEAAGRVDTLNDAFSREVAKATDEEGAFDVSKLNKNDLIRYRASIGALVGEDADAYDKRMQRVFNGSNYIGAIAQILDEQDIDSLRRIEARSPGDNPLAASLSKHLKQLEEQEQNQ